MEDKLGMPLEEIHLSGSVPQCASHFVHLISSPSLRFSGTSLFYFYSFCLPHVGVTGTVTFYGSIDVH